MTDGEIFTYVLVVVHLDVVHVGVVHLGVVLGEEEGVVSGFLVVLQQKTLVYLDGQVHI